MNYSMINIGRFKGGSSEKLINRKARVRAAIGK
jgi:hypothetical protein